MPILEYKCQRPSCGHVQERIFVGKFEDAPWTFNCERCLVGGSSRIMSAPARVIMDDGSRRKKRERIKEPVWRDLETGKVEAVNP